MPDGGTAHEAAARGFPTMSTCGCAIAARSRRPMWPSSSSRGPGQRPQLAGRLDACRTAQLSAAAAIPPGGQTVVGPFAWTPHGGRRGRLAGKSSAAGDLSNADTVNGRVAAPAARPVRQQHRAARTSPSTWQIPASKWPTSPTTSPPSTFRKASPRASRRSSATPSVTAIGTSHARMQHAQRIR